VRVNLIGIVSGLAALVLIAVLLGGWWFSEPLARGAHRDLLSGFVGGLIAAILTVGLGWVAWKQLNDIARTTSADFLLRLKHDFFRDEARTLITLVANKWLRFVDVDANGNEVDIPYMEVRQDVLTLARLPEDVKERLRTPSVYTAFEIDDLLLGPLDDVAVLYEKGILNLDMVRQVFRWYVKVAWDDRDVRAYIEHQQCTEDPQIYAPLGRLRARMD
jgi:hypothetical protein